ncbi:hypothetical protein Bca101_016777 [Brassica carinata]
MDLSADDQIFRYPQHDLTCPGWGSYWLTYIRTSENTTFRRKKKKCLRKREERTGGAKSDRVGESPESLIFSNLIRSAVVLYPLVL